MILLLKPHDPFPDPYTLDDEQECVAQGGVLDTATLLAAYQQGLFPWYSRPRKMQWWCTNPRMILEPCQFRYHRSLAKKIKTWQKHHDFRVEMNAQFEQVIQACAQIPRAGQQGTWILPEMQRAYLDLHHQGYAHSMEVYWKNTLVAGLYGVQIGRMWYGESMFTTITDGSKVALAALIAWCLHHQIPLIDCQQVTNHLALMGAYPVPRKVFLQRMKQAQQAQSHPSQAITWSFDEWMWTYLQKNGKKDESNR